MMNMVIRTTAMKDTCRKCGEFKYKKYFAEHFNSKNGKTYRAHICKDCENKQNRATASYKAALKPEGIRKQKSGLLIEHRGRGNRIVMTPQMEADLKRFFANTKNKEVAEILGVSERTMLRWAKKLGLNKSKAFIREAQKNALLLAQVKNRKVKNAGMFAKGYVPKNKKYEFDKDWVRENYPYMSTKAVAEHEGVDINAINCLAAREGLHKDGEYLRTMRYNNGLILYHGRLD